MPHLGALRDWGVDFASAQTPYPATLLALGGALTWFGKPDREISYTAAGELWADVLRDADQLGLQVTRVSDKEEMDLGRKIAQQYLSSSAVAQAWQPYVSAVGSRLAANASRKGITYQFHVVESPSVNAFALPGGQIVVFTGLLDIVESESELAAVMGHEIAHIDARHCIERFQYQMKLKKLGLGAVAGLGELAQVLIAQGYAQHHELEADSLGLRLAMAAGYDPRGSELMFRRLMKANGEGFTRPASTPIDELLRVMGTAATDYFRSHPPTPERLRRTAGLIAQESKRNAGKAFYVGRQNHRNRTPRSQQEFPGESVRL